MQISKMNCSYMYVCMYVGMHVCMYVSMYVCMYAFCSCVRLCARSNKMCVYSDPGNAANLKPPFESAAQGSQ